MNSEFHQYLEHERLGAVLHRSRLDRLEADAARLMADFVEGRNVSLALSLGKDSMTLLHIAYKYGILPKVRMVMWNNSGIETRDTFAMRDYVITKYGLAWQFIETCPSKKDLKESLAMADLSAAHPVREFVYRCLELPRWEAMDRHNIDGTIMGLRAEESHARKISARMRGRLYANKREQADILTPLSWWKTEDVFEYAAREQIPLHPVYAKALKYGKERLRTRHNTPADPSFMNQGDLVFIKHAYPETFAKLGRYIPGIAAM